MAESIDEFLGNAVEDGAGAESLATTTAADMAGFKPRGCACPVFETRGSEALRVSFVAGGERLCRRQAVSKQSTQVATVWYRLCSEGQP